MNIFLNAFRKLNLFSSTSFPLRNKIKALQQNPWMFNSIQNLSQLLPLQQTKSYLIYFRAYKTLFSNRMTTWKTKNNFIPSLKENFLVNYIFSKNTLRGISREMCVFNKLPHELKYIFLKFNLEFFFEFSIQSIANFFRHTKYYKRFLINKMIGNRSGS